MEKKKILVVEDDSVLRDILVEKFDMSGYRATGAEDGEIAMETMKKDIPDLILLDILMPKKDGMQVMEEMSTDADLKDIPIIVVSNSGQPVEIERAKKLGARDFLVKAVFEPNEVLDKVNTILNNPKETNYANEADQKNSTKHKESPEIIEKPKSKTNANKVHGDIKVLVVEDDKFLRELLVRKLYGEGFIVESAIDAGGTFEILEKFVPNIILLDLILPGIDGFEILSRIKKNNSLSKVPVIILSNLGQKEDIDHAMSLGATGFMVKANFTLDEIVNKVQKILGGD